jgi:hypothetical protein
MLSEANAPLLRSIKAVDAIEETGLPRAIGADDGEDLTLEEIKGEICKRLNPAEAQL